MESSDHHRPPWLLITDDSRNIEKQYFCDITKNRFHPTNIPELGQVILFASAYGWLVLVDLESEQCYMWNPTTLGKIEIGLLSFPRAYSDCILSKPPSEPDCHVVFYSSDGLHQAFYRIVRLEGDDNDGVHVVSLYYWGEEEIKLLAAASFEGEVYCLVDTPYRFVTLHFVDQTVEYRPILKEEGGEPWSNITDPLREWGAYTTNHLIKSPCGQEFLLVHMMLLCGQMQDDLDFRVFRVDIDRKECTELENIGGRAIFVSHRGGAFCCYSSPAGIKPNCVYYTVQNWRDYSSKNVFVYDLDDRSVTPFMSCPAARRTKSVRYWVENAAFRGLFDRV